MSDDRGRDAAAEAAAYASRSREATEYVRARVREFITVLSDQVDARYGGWEILVACYHEDLGASPVDEIAREVIKSMGGEVCPDGR